MYRLPLKIMLVLACAAATSCGGQLARHRQAVIAVAEIETNGLPRSGNKEPLRYFAANSIWNKVLSAQVPLDPSSAALAADLDREISTEELDARAPFINTTAWSVPIYTVPRNQPTVRVRLVDRQPEPALRAAWAAVPLPPDAKPAAGTDMHLAVWQPSRDRLWEFWRLEHSEAGWQASWGGAMRDVSSNPGVYGPEAWPGARRVWGASGSSLSIVGGLITLEDLELGQINHALAMAIPDVRAGVYATPAERSDGVSSAPGSLPEGAHLRLDPKLNLSLLHLPRLTMMMAVAAQRYGIVIVDKSMNVTFFAQDPAPTGTDPYTGVHGYFEDKSPVQLLASFPWSHLEVLRMTLHRRAPA